MYQVLVANPIVAILLMLATIPSGLHRLIVMAVTRTVSKAYFVWWGCLIASIPILAIILLITYYSNQWQLAFYVTAALILIIIPTIWMLMGLRRATVTMGG